MYSTEVNTCTKHIDIFAPYLHMFKNSIAVEVRLEALEARLCGCAI